MHEVSPLVMRNGLDGRPQAHGSKLGRGFETPVEDIARSRAAPANSWMEVVHSSPRRPGLVVNAIRGCATNDSRRRNLRTAMRRDAHGMSAVRQRKQHALEVPQHRRERDVKQDAHRPSALHRPLRVAECSHRRTADGFSGAMSVIALARIGVAGRSQPWGRMNLSTALRISATS